MMFLLKNKNSFYIIDKMTVKKHKENNNIQLILKKTTHIDPKLALTNIFTNNAYQLKKTKYFIGRC